jgi:hypothetical protein
MNERCTFYYNCLCSNADGPCSLEPKGFTKCKFIKPIVHVCSICGTDHDDVCMMGL